MKLRVGPFFSPGSQLCLVHFVDCYSVMFGGGAYARPPSYRVIWPGWTVCVSFVLQRVRSMFPRAPGLSKVTGTGGCLVGSSGSSAPSTWGTILKPHKCVELF